MMRIVSFCEKYDSDADPGFLAIAVAQSVVLDQPRYLLLLGFAETDELRSDVPMAHLLATLEEYHGRRVVMISQLEHDPDAGRFSDEVYTEGLRQVREWALSLGASTIRVWARTEQVARVFEKRAGFVRSPRVLMTLELDEAEADGGES
jgi:hypothetical protein